LHSVLSPLRGFYREFGEHRDAVHPTTDLQRFVGRYKKRVATKPLYFKADEMTRLLETAAIACPRWRPFVMSGCFAGLRWGESAALLWSDVDWTRGYLAIERTVSDRNRIEAPKDGEARRVKVSAGFLDALRAHQEAMALEGQVQGWSAESRAIVFPTMAGNRLAYAYFVGVWRDLQAEAGVGRRPYKAT
jgi:integrase